MPTPVAQPQPMQGDIVPAPSKETYDPSTGQCIETIKNGTVPGPVLDNPVQKPATFVERPGEEASDSSKEKSIEGA